MQTAGGAPGLRITQHFDAAGNPAYEVHLRDLSNEMRGLIPYEPYEGALQVLDALNATPLEDRRLGVFAYTDPGRGSGFIEMLGFDQHACETILDVFRVRERSAQLGIADPVKRRRDRVGTIPGSSYGRNPVLMTVLTALSAVMALCVSALFVCVSPLVPELQVFLVVLSLCMLAGAVSQLWPLVRHARRIPWWRRMRASFEQSGEPLPRELQSIP